MLISITQIEYNNTKLSIEGHRRIHIHMYTNLRRYFQRDFLKFKELKALLISSSVSKFTHS